MRHNVYKEKAQFCLWLVIWFHFERTKSRNRFAIVVNMSAALAAHLQTFLKSDALKPGLLAWTKYLNLKTAFLSFFFFFFFFFFFSLFAINMHFVLLALVPSNLYNTNQRLTETLLLIPRILSHYHHQSRNREGRLGTTDDFATSFLHFSLFSTALWDLPNSRPVHSLMSPHLFLCLPCLFHPFTVPCKIVLARPDEQETWPYHCSLHLFMMVRSSCGLISCWIFAQTSSLVTWSLYEMCSILR